MKLSGWTKKTPPRTLSPEIGGLSDHGDSVQEVAPDIDVAFFHLMAKSAGLERKDFQYGMRVSKELVKMWFEGTRHNPIRRARDCVTVFRSAPRGKSQIPTVLKYIAGDDFTGRILNNEESAALDSMLALLSKRAGEAKQ